MTSLKGAIRPGVRPRGWGRLLHRLPPMSGHRANVAFSGSASAAKAKDSSGRAAKPPLEVMPISVWSPPAQSAEPPPTIAEELGRKRPEADEDEDSLLSNVELAAGAIPSILRDSDLKRSGSLHVEEVLALSLQGVTSVSSRVLICLPLSWFRVVHLFCVVYWQAATHLKSLAKRASLNKGRSKAARAYKAKVASLTSERAEL